MKQADKKSLNLVALDRPCSTHLHVWATEPQRLSQE